MAGLASCQSEDDIVENSSSYEDIVINALLSDASDSRTTMVEEGEGYKVVWGESDAISVFCGSAKAHNMAVLKTGAGETDAEFQLIPGSMVESNPNGFANVGLYPYFSSTSVSKYGDNYEISTVIPTNQNYSENSFGAGASPMVAVSDNWDFSFKNIASAMIMPLKGNVLITRATLESAAHNIAGAATVTAIADNGWIPTIDMTEGSSMIALSCGDGIQLNETTPTNFIFVLAPGTYEAGDLTVKFYAKNGEYYAYNYTTKKQTFTRSVAKKFNVASYSVTGQIGIEEANNALANGIEEVSVFVATTDENPTLELPKATSENPTNLTFESIPKEKTVTIKASTESNNQEATVVNVYVPKSTHDGYNFDIQLPNSTVALNAKNGNGNYNNVTAETAENTLIIRKDVFVKNLKIKAGNVHVYGKIDAITRHENNENIVTVYVESGAVIPDNLGDGFKVIYIDSDGYRANVATETELKGALADKTYDKIVLTDNIEMSEILVINRDVELDGNGNKLVSTMSGSSGRAINVSGVTDVTIKDLTIEAAGQRAINIIQNSKKVTIENVTATADNYTINVAASAANAQVIINNSDLTGLNTVNLAGANGTVSINNTKITCNDQNDSEAYAAIVTNKDAQNTTVTVNGGEIVTKDNSSGGLIVGKKSNITINGTKGNTTIKVTPFIIEYSSGYDYSFSTFEEALEKAENGETIKVTNDIKIENALVFDENKNVTLNLDGCTITSEGDGIEVRQGTLTITGNGTVKAGVDNPGQWVAVWANSGNVVIENGIYSVEADVNDKTNDCIYAKGGTIEINGGTFSNAGIYDSSAGGVVINAHNTVANSKVIINGGTFNPSEGCVKYEEDDVTTGRIIIE